jgi:hypothetical protein
VSNSNIVLVMRLADLKLLRYVAGDVVTIFIGPKRKRYIVHKDLICEKAGYFTKALNKKGFKEGTEKEIYLPEDEPDAFDLFIQWLYNSRLDCKAFCVEGKSSAEIHEPCWTLMSTLISLYILADKICLEELKNTVMDNFKDIGKTHKFTPFAIIRIYAKGPSGSPLRRLAARKCKHDIQAFGGLIGYSDGTWTEAIERNKGFAIDILHAIADGEKHRPSGGTGLWNPCEDPDCKYHEHKSTPKCADTSDSRGTLNKEKGFAKRGS